MSRLFTIAFFCVIYSMGCTTQNVLFVSKSEEELDSLERQAESVTMAYDCGRYEEAIRGFNELSRDRTVSQLLYQLDSVPPLIFGKHEDEAHGVMEKLRVDIEELYSVESEKRALSKWHGEINKVYKGNSHEVATFYALLAMSYAKRGAFDDAWRCVQNGLLYDSDSKQGYRADFAMLWYLGWVYARKIGEEDFAVQCRKGLEDALMQRRLMYDRTKNSHSPISVLFNENTPNGMICVWTGGSPRYGRGGENGNKRVILRGADNMFDYISIVDEIGRECIVPQKLCDINFQASTRGGRIMDEVLKLKSEYKNRLIDYKETAGIVSEGFSRAGLPGDPFAKVAGFAMSSLSKMIQSGVSTLADSVDARADIRSWRTLPGCIDVCPLWLKAGRHKFRVCGYACGKIVVERDVFIDIPEDGGINVVHVKFNDMKMGAEVEVVRSICSNKQLEDDGAVQSMKDISSKFVGVWRCWMDVEFKKFVGYNAEQILDLLPVSTEITMELEKDGTAKLTELEGKIFGMSSGSWRFHNGMLELTLKNEYGHSYRMNALVSWKGNDIFALRYMANDWRDMMRGRLQGRHDYVMAGCSYQGDKMKLTVVTGKKTPQSAECFCTINFFRRQWGLRINGE